MRPVSLTSPGACQRLTVNTPCGGQTLKEDPPSLDGVETVLRQGEGAGSGGGPGVDQTHLDDVEGAISTGKPASRLVDLEGEAGLTADGGVIRRSAASADR